MRVSPNAGITSVLSQATTLIRSEQIACLIQFRSNTGSVLWRCSLDHA
jgi:hypothetical protein